MRHFLFCILGTIAFASFFAGCSNADATSEQHPGSSKTKTSVAKSAGPAWDVVAVAGESHVEQVELPGASIHGFETTQLMAKVGGYVGEIKKIKDNEVDIGTTVEKGAPLVVLDIPEMKEEVNGKIALVAKANSMVAQAEAAVEAARADVEHRKAQVEQTDAQRKEFIAKLNLRQAEYKRISKLVEDGAIGTENLDESKFAMDAAESALVSASANVRTAQSQVVAANAIVAKAQADKQNAIAQVDVAKASLALTKAREQYATIRAPYHGIITKRFVDHGAFVKPATSNSGAMALFEIARTDKVRVVAAVPTVQARKIAVGQKAEFHNIGGLPGVTIKGQVDRSATAFDPDSRQMRIEVHFSNPRKDPKTGNAVNLMPGMYGNVRVILKEWDSLPVVPTNALAHDATGSSFVIVVDNQNICQQRIVEIAFNDGKTVGLSSGVKIGERVLLGDIEQVKDGQKITVKSP